MIARSIALDTNLLVLLIVGSASRRYIDLHKRTRTDTADDFDLLAGILADVESIVVTPNVLTEASNLIRQFGEPGRTQVGVVMQRFIEESIELYVPSRTAVHRPEFLRLGLADTAIIAGQDKDMALLTDDLDLYLASANSGQAAVNFSHLRDHRGP